MAKEGFVQVDLSVVERLWVQKSLSGQVSILKRSLTKELPGSDIYVLRQKEIDFLNTLLSRFS